MGLELEPLIQQRLKFEPGCGHLSGTVTDLYRRIVGRTLRDDIVAI